MKKLIYLIIIVLGLGGALVMGYMVIRSSGQGSPEAVVITTESADNSYQILPFGKELDFESLQKYNKNKNLFPYPKVSPAEIGVTSGSIME